jgi:hypothetical protein
MAGRIKGSTNKNSKPRNKEPKPQKKCSTCGEEQVLGNFYLSESPLHLDNKIPYCKLCLRKIFDENTNPEESLMKILKLIDKPFFYHLYESAKSSSPDNIFGEYMRLVIMPQNRGKGYTWESSVFKPKSIENNINYDESKQVITLNNQFQLTDALIDKWGDGYTPEEYKSFERKYNMLKNNYQEKTAMHTEALLTYIRYRAKEELSTAQGDSKAAKEWGTLAKDAATAAKINPSQLSKSDLTDGLDTFGQLVRSVEQAVDIIPILPRFKEKPQDKVDFTLWCYINYIRDLKGLPLVEFKEIYNFYEVRKKEYENSQSDDEGDF